jgi:hypothetical protein
MPYTDPADRKLYDELLDLKGPRDVTLKQLIETGDEGDLNYVISIIVDIYAARIGGLHYAESINAVIGALECAKLEFYRRVAAPYEDHKQYVNGDVYLCSLPLVERALTVPKINKQDLYRVDL